MPTHIHVRLPSEPEHKHKTAHHDDDRQPPGWSKPREPKDEPQIKSLTAGAGLDKWAKRASDNSGPRIAPGPGTKKSSQ